MFSKGDKVKSTIFGVGEVYSIVGDGLTVRAKSSTGMGHSWWIVHVSNVTKVEDVAKDS